MNIDFVKDSQTDEIRSMWKYCFGDGDVFLDWFFGKVYKSENTLAVFENGRVAANLQIFPYDISLRGNTCPAGYIAGVAALPEYRGRGFVKALMRAAVTEMYKRGYAYALLIPFEFDFYRRFGFECCYHLAEYSGRIESLRKFAMAGGEFKRYDNAPLDVYGGYVKNKNGYIIRNGRIFDEINEDAENGNGHVYILSSGGYIIYHIENNSFNALEIAFCGREQLFSILGFIYSHASQAQNFKIRCAADGFLGSVLCETNITETRRPHVAARAVNVRRALEILSRGAKEGAAVAVADDLIPENNRAFEADSGSVREAGNGLKMGIETFTRLSLGAVSPDEAKQLGLLDSASAGLFKKEVNYINMLGWV